MTMYPRVPPCTPVPPCTESLRAPAPPHARARVGGGYTRVRGYKPHLTLTAQGVRGTRAAAPAARPGDAAAVPWRTPPPEPERPATDAEEAEIARLLSNARDAEARP